MDLWIPSSARDTQPAKYQCRICNGKFVEFRAFESHVITCSKVHENELADASAWHSEFHEHPDPEWHQYNEDLRQAGLDPNIQFSRNRKTNIRRASES